MKEEACKKWRGEEKGRKNEKDKSWHSLPFDLCLHHNSFSTNIWLLSINLCGRFYYCSQVYAAHPYRRIIIPTPLTSDLAMWLALSIQMWVEGTCDILELKIQSYCVIQPYFHLFCHKISDVPDKSWFFFLDLKMKTMWNRAIANVQWNWPPCGWRN